MKAHHQPSRPSSNLSLNKQHATNKALLFRNGEKELALPPDLQAFGSYLQKAEALGDPEALYCLADMHLHGPFVFFWGVGVYYYNYCVWIVYARLVVWRCMRWGLGPIRPSLTILRFIIVHVRTSTPKGTDGVEKDEARAIDYYHKAGTAGHADALTTLGALYHQRGRYEEVSACTSARRLLPDGVVVPSDESAG
jgi:TPR repeat protein